MTVISFSLERTVLGFVYETIIARVICKKINMQIFDTINFRCNHSNGWLDDLRFYVLFNSISVISGRCQGDNERMCTMESRLLWNTFPTSAGIEFGTARSAGKRFHLATGAPALVCSKVNPHFAYMKSRRIIRIPAYILFLSKPTLKMAIFSE